MMMMCRITAVVALLLSSVVVVTADQTPAPGAICPSFDGSCFGCTTLAPSNNCGYSANTGKCLEGNANGPLISTATKGNFGGGDWHWNVSSCSSGNTSFQLPNSTATPTAADPSSSTSTSSSSGATPSPAYACAQYSGLPCATCTGSPSGHCGYCGATNRCMEGTASGPSNSKAGGCALGWSWYRSQCT